MGKNKFQREIERLLLSDEKKMAKELSKVYQTSIDEIKEQVKSILDEDEDLSFNKQLRIERLNSIRSQLENRLKVIKGEQHTIIYRYLNSLGHIGYNELFYEFEMTQQIPISFTLLSDKAILAIINTPVANIKLSNRLDDGIVGKLKSSVMEVIRRGFRDGSSYSVIARNLANEGKSSYKRALNIARTEGGRISGVTHQMSQVDAMKVGARVKKTWDSALDGRTRDTHAALDGQVKEIDEYFVTVNGDKALQPHMFGIASEDCGCRCRSRSVIEGYEPQLRRDGETGEVIKHKNYKEWVIHKNTRFV